MWRASWTSDLARFIQQNLRRHAFPGKFLWAQHGHEGLGGLPRWQLLQRHVDFFLVMEERLVSHGGMVDCHVGQLEDLGAVVLVGIP